MRAILRARVVTSALRRYRETADVDVCECERERIRKNSRSFIARADCRRAHHPFRISSTSTRSRYSQSSGEPRSSEIDITLIVGVFFYLEGNITLRRVDVNTEKTSFRATGIALLRGLLRTKTDLNSIEFCAPVIARRKSDERATGSAPLWIDIIMIINRESLRKTWAHLRT